MVRRHRAMSNRGLLLSSITALLLVGFIVTNLASYYYLKASLRASIIDSQLPKSSMQAYSEITHNILPALVASSMLANDHYVQSWLQGDKSDMATMTHYLEKVKLRNSAIIAFLVADDTKQYYNSEGFTVFERRGDPMAQWYFDFIESGLVSDMNVGPNIDKTQTPTLFINYRISLQGDDLGVVGLGIELGVINDILNRYQRSHNQSIYFISDSGEIISHSSGAGLDQSSLAAVPGLTAALSSFDTRDSSFYEYRNDSGNYLLHLRYIPELDWWMLVEQEEALTFARVGKILYTNVLISLATIVVIILTVTLVTRHFHRQLETLANTDSLTGLDNRQAFDAKVDVALAQSRRNETPLSFLMIDIDRFKTINDQFGHPVGDMVLQQVASLIDGGIRKSDGVARWGGEEFVVMAYNSTLDNAMVLAEKLRSQIEASESLYAQVTISIGVAQAGPAESFEAVLHRADIALYQAKNAGRNRVKSHP